jgi:hypothetical protein
VPRVGLTLPPNAGDLDLLASLIDDEVDYYEVAPETLWREAPDGGFGPNGFHERFARLKRATRRPFVAHGVGLSLGTVAHGDEARRARWHERIRADHDVFDFEWYSDHLGVTVLDGQFAMLPLPVPMTDAMADVIHANLRLLQEVVPRVGVENSVVYHTFGDPLDEPDFLGRILRSPGMHLVLDLHNLWTMSKNHGFEIGAYLATLDLGRVIEIHVSGGTDSNPRWLESGGVMRMDSHCSAVPAEVWGLLDAVAPRCPGLRGVTLERMESTIGGEDVEVLRSELRRIREVGVHVP